MEVHVTPEQQAHKEHLPVTNLKERKRMPTILLVKGWRIFFYSNEGNEPMHVHSRKGSVECKFWIDLGRFEIEEDFERGFERSFEA